MDQEVRPEPGLDKNLVPSASRAGKNTAQKVGREAPYLLGWVLAFLEPSGAQIWADFRFRPDLRLVMAGLPVSVSDRDGPHTKLESQPTHRARLGPHTKMESQLTPLGSLGLLRAGQIQLTPRGSLGLLRSGQVPCKSMLRAAAAKRKGTPDNREALAKPGTPMLLEVSTSA